MVLLTRLYNFQLSIFNLTMIVVTGAAGFIGSVVAGELNNKGYNNLILVDDFSKKEKERNYINLEYKALVDRNVFFDWFKENHEEVSFIVHLGARTDTTEFDWNVFLKLNVDYTETMFSLCAEYQIPLVYASSAATYGNGELGYDDSHDVVEKLQPLNPYGRSKNEVDKWILKQDKQPPFWAGLKFFNVYGPNEYHKGRMASVIFHSFNQINATGKVKLFRSHRPDFADGQQLRDFIYVKDIARANLFMAENPHTGVYNVAYGKKITILELAEKIIKLTNSKSEIVFLPERPGDIRHSLACVDKLAATGFTGEWDFERGLAAAIEAYKKEALK